MNKYFTSDSVQLAGALAFLLFLSCGIWSQPASPAIEAADKFYDRQEWRQAVDAYKQLVGSAATPARIWFRIGNCYQRLKEYKDAEVAFERALSLAADANKPPTYFRIAEVNAALGKTDDAFTNLNKAYALGYSTGPAPEKDDELQKLHDDPRWSTVVLAADKVMSPCKYRAENRQFDFWLGEWEVHDHLGNPVGKSRIESVENGCIILENWSGSQTGRSMNFYDPALKKWRQTWVDATGLVSEFSGEYSDGALRLTGETHVPGRTVLRRLTFTDLGNQRVRQFSEASLDGGKTWQTNYDFTYSRPDKKDAKD